MESKLFVFVAILAVQGTVFAGVLPVNPEDLPADAQVENSENLIYSLQEVSENKALHTIFHKADLDPYGNPLKCLGYIEEAYHVAKDAEKFAEDASSFISKLYDDIRKCAAFSNVLNNVECLLNTGKPALEKGKALYNTFNVLKPKVVDLFNKFKKCLD